MMKKKERIKALPKYSNVTLNDLAELAMSPEYDYKEFVDNIKVFLGGVSQESVLAFTNLDTTFVGDLDLVNAKDARSYVNALIAAEARAYTVNKNNIVSPMQITDDQYAVLYDICKAYCDGDLFADKREEIGEALFEMVRKADYEQMEASWGPLTDYDFIKDSLTKQPTKERAELCDYLEKMPKAVAALEGHSDAYKAFKSGENSKEQLTEICLAIMDGYNKDCCECLEPANTVKLINENREWTIGAIKSIAYSMYPYVDFSIMENGKIAANGIPFINAVPGQRIKAGLDNYMDRSVLSYCRNKDISLRKHQESAPGFDYIKGGKCRSFDGTLSTILPPSVNKTVQEMRSL